MLTTHRAAAEVGDARVEGDAPGSAEVVSSEDSERYPSITAEAPRVFRAIPLRSGQGALTVTEAFVDHQRTARGGPLRHGKRRPPVTLIQQTRWTCLRRVASSARRRAGPASDGVWPPQPQSRVSSRSSKLASPSKAGSLIATAGAVSAWVIRQFWPGKVLTTVTLTPAPVRRTSEIAIS